MLDYVKIIYGDNMKNKGFTLAEILGVIVIIGLLLLLVAPAIVNRIAANKGKVSKAAEKIIYSATQQYIDENRSDYANSKNFCITVQTLINDGKLASPVQDPISNNTYDNYGVSVTVDEYGAMDYTLKEEGCQD